MPFKRICAYGLAALLLTSMACSKGNPASPSVSTPQSLIPTTGTAIPNSAQPVTLVVQNALASATGTTYTFEVATDVAFANKVQTKAGVAENASGQTSTTLSPLTAGADYYWHAQAITGGTAGLFSTAFKFTIGPAVALSAPTLVSPANGSVVSTQPTLTVNNALRTGPVGVVAYRFDISTSSSFATIVASGSAPEGSGQTSFTPSPALAISTPFYWRATAIDQTNLASSAASVTGTFTTVAFTGAAASLANQLGQVLWTGAVPGGTNGHATLGDNCDGTPNWAPTTCFSTFAPTYGQAYQSPTLEMVRIFDLLDRGYDPQGAINWMQGNGYATTAAWYPTSVTIGFPNVYIAARSGFIGSGAIWDVVGSSG